MIAIPEIINVKSSVLVINSFPLSNVELTGCGAVSAIRVK